MNDFLNEVEEDLKRERYEKLWQKYSAHVFAAIALIIAGTAGFQYYQKQETQKAQNFGTAFETSSLLARDSKPQEAQDILAKLIGEGANYKDLARLKLAEGLLEKDKVGALASLKAIATDLKTDKFIRDAALIKTLYIESETLSSEALKTLSAPLEQSEFKFAAREVVITALMREGKKEEAAKAMTELLALNGAPSSLKARVTLLQATLQGK